ncbi:creatininase family protein [Saccharopolyspora shandongensis]|uniref:creatininase family protein n=1 Tax=Saccharopolyspora shandongensis TaxID=418495 RepID=UPI000B84FC62
MSELERLRVALTAGARPCREQHGAHLPLATDSVMAHIIATRLCDASDLLLLPPTTISCSHEHEGLLAGTVSVRATMLHVIVTDIADPNRCRNQRTTDAKFASKATPAAVLGKGPARPKAASSPRPKICTQARGRRASWCTLRPRSSAMDARRPTTAPTNAPTCSCAPPIERSPPRQPHGRCPSAVLPAEQRRL